MIDKFKWRINAILEYEKFKKQYSDAKNLLQSSVAEDEFPVCFIGGCGRSGTTLLGHLLSFHKEVYYLNEPRAKWAVVNPQTDIWGYWFDPKLGAHFIIENLSPEEKRRFNKVFFDNRQSLNGKFLVEKSPENAFRLAWLLQLKSDAKFIHMLRNGADVIRSILVESSFDIPYGLQDMNNWYGKNGVKKNLLINTAKKVSLDENVINCCKTDIDYAALEWICSVKYIESFWINIPEENRTIIRYEELLEKPLKTFEVVLDLLRLNSDVETQQKIAAYVKTNTKSKKIFRLATPLNKLFNDVLADYGYSPL